MSPNHGIFPHDVSFTASKLCAAHHKNYPNLVSCPRFRHVLRSHDAMMSPNHGISPHDVSFAVSQTRAAHYQSCQNPALLPATQTRPLLQRCRFDNSCLSPLCIVSTSSATDSTHCGFECQGDVESGYKKGMGFLLFCFFVFLFV